MDNQADRLTEICCRRLRPRPRPGAECILLSELAQGNGPALYVAPDNYVASQVRAKTKADAKVDMADDPEGYPGTDVTPGKAIEHMFYQHVWTRSPSWRNLIVPQAGPLPN